MYGIGPPRLLRLNAHMLQAAFHDRPRNGWLRGVWQQIHSTSAAGTASTAV